MRFNTDRLKLEVSRAQVPFFWLIFLVVATIITGAIIVGNLNFVRPWDSYYTVRAAFTDAKGVFIPEDPVRIAGVKVGTVSGEKFVGGHAVLTMSLDPQYGPIYRNATAVLKASTLLDDMYVDLIPGTPSAGRLGRHYVLPVSQTVSPVDIATVLDTFNAPTRERMTIMLDELSKGLADGGAQLQQGFMAIAPFLHAAQSVAQQMAQRQALLKGLVHNVGVLAGALNTRDQQITDLIRSGDSSLGSLAQADAPFSQTLAAFPPALSELESSMSAVRAAETTIDPALSSLEPVAAHLRQGLSALQRFATSATPALSALRPSVSSLRVLAYQLHPTAGSLGNALTVLRPQGTGIDQIVADTVPCLSTLQAFFQNTNSVFAYGNAYGTFPRGETTVSVAAGPLDPVIGNDTPAATCTGHPQPAPKP
jgi:phospholipid/cholesterol/gamma-HCH transport system substrate-binding protein